MIRRDIIWHITDIHANHTKGSPGTDVKNPNLPRDLRSAHLKEIFDALESKKALIQKLQLSPDWLAIGGDLGTTNQSEELDEALGFVRMVAELFSLPENRVVLTVGNHDVVRGDAGNVPALDKADSLGFLSPRSDVGHFANDSGLAIIPVDTAGLNAIPVVESTWKRRAAKALGIPGADDFYRAGSITDTSLQNLRDVCKAVREKTPGFGFPILLCHHPVSRPPQYAGEVDEQDATVLAPKLRKQLLDAGVGVVLQGHKHSMVAHAEELYVNNNLHGEICYVTGASLYRDESAYIHCIDLQRSDIDNCAILSGFGLDARNLRDEPRQNIQIYTRLVGHGNRRYGKGVRKDLVIEKDGVSTVRYYYYDHPNLGTGAVPIEFRAHDGLFVSQPVSDLIGYSSDKRPKFKTEVVAGGIGNPSASMAAELAKNCGRYSLFARAKAIGAHACSKQESILLHGKAGESDQWEFTEWYCHTSSERFCCTISFPVEGFLPSRDEVVVYGTAGIPKQRPRGPHDVPDELFEVLTYETLICEKERRIEVRMKYPLAGNTYFVFWKLKSEAIPGENDSCIRLIEEYASHVKRPRVYTWKEALATTANDQMGPSDKIKHCVCVAAQGLQRMYPGVKNWDGYELTFLMPTETLGQNSKDGSRVRIVSAIGPEGSLDWGRWESELRYGTGIAGYAIRNSTRVGWTLHGRDKSEMELLIDHTNDGGKKYQSLFVAPGVVDGNESPIGSVGTFMLASYGEDETIPVSSTASQLAMSGKIWSFVNGYFAESKMGAKVKAPGVEMEEEG